MIETMQINNEGEKAPSPLQLNTLTLEKNAVLVVKIPRGEYDTIAADELYKACTSRFPCHGVLLVYNDVEFSVINDKGYAAERITCNNDASNYY